MVEQAAPLRVFFGVLRESLVAVAMDQDIPLVEDHDHVKAHGAFLTFSGLVPVMRAPAGLPCTGIRLMVDQASRQ